MASTMKEFLTEALKDDGLNEGREHELAKRNVTAIESALKTVNKGIRTGSKNITMAGVEKIEKETKKLSSLVTKTWDENNESVNEKSINEGDYQNALKNLTTHMKTIQKGMRTSKRNIVVSGIDKLTDELEELRKSVFDDQDM